MRRIEDIHHIAQSAGARFALGYSLIRGVLLMLFVVVLI
jgi:hypothetical protein